MIRRAERRGHPQTTSASRRPWSARTARLRRIRRDEGTSLIELMVGMTLIAVFLAIFTGAILMMTTAMNKSQAVNLASTQLNVAVQNVDEIVRYAAGISRPGVGRSGDWYVELRSMTRGDEVCTQLRVHVASQQLQRRTWPANDRAAVSTWLPIASGITNGNAPKGPTNQPFWLVPPPATATFQQLTINLAALAGTGPSATTSTSSVTVSALNSRLPAPTTPICQQLGRP